MAYILLRSKKDLAEIAQMKVRRKVHLFLQIKGITMLIRLGLCFFRFSFFLSLLSPLLIEFVFFRSLRTSAIGSKVHEERL